MLSRDGVRFLADAGLRGAVADCGEGGRGDAELMESRDFNENEESDISSMGFAEGLSWPLTPCSLPGPLLASGPEGNVNSLPPIRPGKYRSGLGLRF